MDAPHGIVFCETCGKGINVIVREEIHQCLNPACRKKYCSNCKGSKNDRLCPTCREAAEKEQRPLEELRQLAQRLKDVKERSYELLGKLDYDTFSRPQPSLTSYIFKNSAEKQKQRERDYEEYHRLDDEKLELLRSIAAKLEEIKRINITRLPSEKIKIPWDIQSILPSKNELGEPDRAMRRQAEAMRRQADLERQLQKLQDSEDFDDEDFEDEDFDDEDFDDEDLEDEDEDKKAE
jgi:hypothetical protein